MRAAHQLHVLWIKKVHWRRTGTGKGPVDQWAGKQHTVGRHACTLPPSGARQLLAAPSCMPVHACPGPAAHPARGPGAGGVCAASSQSPLPVAPPALQARLRILHEGQVQEVSVQLRSPRRLIPVHINNAPPSYYILGGVSCWLSAWAHCRRLPWLRFPMHINSATVQLLGVAIGAHTARVLWCCSAPRSTAHTNWLLIVASRAVGSCSQAWCSRLLPCRCCALSMARRVAAGGPSVVFAIPHCLGVLSAC